MSAAPATFPITFAVNKQTLSCSANSPDTIETIFQCIVAQIFGYDLTSPVPTDNDATNPFWTVRVGWQEQGQPAWQIDENVCIITAYTDDDPFSRINDMMYTPNDSVSINQEMAYTQVWRIHFISYGPNAFTNGVAIVLGMVLDWVHDALAASNIYSVTEWKRPTVLYELKDGQWWKRADVELRFNELVASNIVVPRAASVSIAPVKDNGLTETVNVTL